MKDKAEAVVAEVTPEETEDEVATAEETVTARLLPLQDRRTDAQRKRLAGTKSFTHVDGKATDPPDDFVAGPGNPSPQQVGIRPRGRHVLDTKWRKVPASMVRTLRERGQIVQVQEEMSEEELLEAGVVA